VVAIANKAFSDVPDALADFDAAFSPDDQPLARLVAGAVLEAVTERSDERVVLGGTAHLARYGESFPLAIQPVLEALEEQVVLLRLLGEATSLQGVTVRIGHENPVEGLEATSVITARYARGDRPVASLGVVGPTHMDYPGTMGAVHAVAQYVSRILDEQ
jgi:heat-inducible transcriptional repressor